MSRSGGNEAGRSLSEWVAPELVELNVAMGDVEAGFDPGTDGSSPGTPDTSQS